MNYIDEIRNYIPTCEQEIKDKELFLQCVNTFNDILTRKNVIAHLTSSGFIINKEKTKTLMIHHNIYNAWGWTGGHMDGDTNLLEVAIKEAKEETGLEIVEPLFNEIGSLDVIPVKAHYKKEHFVSPHLHLSIAYILVADENHDIQIKVDENSNIKWIDINKVMEYTENEPHMQPVYQKLIDKIK